MAIVKIDGMMLKEMFSSGAALLVQNRESVDALNVFPVPDGDTGTNMSMTILAAAKEVGSLENKDITSQIYSWFNNNTDITIVANLLSEEDMNLISEKNYYDIALVNVYAKLDDDEQLLNTISSFIPKEQREMINNSNSKAEKEELFAEIEEDLFNNYRILPLLFYNNTIAVDSTVDSSILDGNGNIDFKSIKK